MCRELLHIYGPFSINSYGTCMLLGIITGLWLFLRDPRRIKLVSTDQTINGLMLCVIVGLVGARILALAQNPETITSFKNIFELWLGGLSFLGSVLSILLFLPLYIAYNKIPLLPTLDLVSIYTLCMEGVARLGCFMAGCCYGAPTQMPWGVVYTDHDSFAPLLTKIHPTQLYSSGLALCAFVFLYIVSKKVTFHNGQLTCLYLMLTCAIRFLVDFWRADREFFQSLDTQFSVHQVIACGIFCGALIVFIFLGLKKKNSHGSI